MLLVALPLLLAALVGVPGTSADEVSQARARQRQLLEAIVRQRAILHELRVGEAQLRVAVARTGATLREIHADQATARREIASATRALRAVEARHAALVAELRHLDWTLGILEGQLAQAERDLQSRQRLLSQRLAEAYSAQQTTLLQQVLVADSFTDALAEVGDHLRLGTQDADLAQQIERDRAALDALRRATAANRYRTEQVRLEVRRQQVAIQEHRARLVAAKLRLDRLAQATRRLQAQQHAAFQRVARSRAEAARLLTQQQAAEDRLKARIEQLVAEQQRRRIAEQRRRAALAERRRADERQRDLSAFSGSTEVAGNGRLRWPMKGWVSQEFGCTGFGWEPPQGSCAHFHRGIDIVAPYGTPVRAAASGSVVFVGYNPYDNPNDPAWIVILSHGGGLSTWYGHLQPIVPAGIREGAGVAPGDVIGYEGNTGHSTGPHLHFAVVRNGTFVNPRLYL
jgi:murein DD-endopeptidase MepM/ murein hydrolase activator NlpD